MQTEPLKLAHRICRHDGWAWLQLHPQVRRALAPAGHDHPWPEQLPGHPLGGLAGQRRPTDITRVDPTTVVEVVVDTAFERGRWRHPIRLVRVRTDRYPAEVRLDTLTGPPTEERGTSTRPRHEPAVSDPEDTMPKTKQSIHVVPGDDGWRVEREGQKRAIATARTQKEAAERGREVARKDKVEFLLHGRDGKIREKDSYGHDPRNIPG